MAANEQAEKTQRSNGKGNFFTVLRGANFRNLWLGQIISQMGDYFAFLALMIVAASVTGDAQSSTLAVSGMMISFSLPRLLFGMLAGVFVDRWDRRKTMLASDLVRGVLTLGLIPAFLSHNLWALYALGFATSSFGTLFNPAKGALIPKLVGENNLLSANSLSQTTQMLATLFGPALAGFTFYAVGPGNEWVAFAVDSLSYFVSAFAISRIKLAASARPELSKPDPNVNPVRQVGQELMVGLRTLFLNRAIATVSLVLGITLLGVGAVNVLWLIVLKERFNLDSSELALRVSILDTVYAAGMIAASLVIGNLLSHLSPKWFIVASLLGMSVGISFFAYLPEYWMMLASMFIVGLFNAPLNTGVSTLVQLTVPNEQLGRVGGGISTVADTSSIVSMSLAGALGAAIGAPLVFVVAGLSCLGTGLLAWAILPAISQKKHSNETAEPLTTANGAGATAEAA